MHRSSAPVCNGQLQLAGQTSALHSRLDPVDRACECTTALLPNRQFEKTLRWLLAVIRHWTSIQQSNASTDGLEECFV